MSKDAVTYVVHVFSKANVSQINKTNSIKVRAVMNFQYSDSTGAIPFDAKLFLIVSKLKERISSIIMIANGARPLVQLDNHLKFFLFHGNEELKQKIIQSGFIVSDVFSSQETKGRVILWLREIRAFTVLVCAK